VGLTHGDRLVRLCGQASPYDVEQRMAITTRKFENNQMVGMFLGVLPQRLFEISVLSYLFGTLYEARARPVWCIPSAH
jgi:hypothetical protein